MRKSYSSLRILIPNLSGTEEGEYMQAIVVMQAIVGTPRSAF